MFGRQHLICRTSQRADCRARSIILEHHMFNVPMVAENRHTVLRRPFDALQIKIFRTFTPTELIDVQAAADIPADDIMPIVMITRRVAWPSLCVAMAEWMVQFEGTRARVLRMERTSWRQHEQLYKDNVLGMCLRMRWAREVWIRAPFTGCADYFRWRLQSICRVYYEPAWIRTTLSCMSASASNRSDPIMVWCITGPLISDGRNTGEQSSSMVQAWL